MRFKRLYLKHFRGFDEREINFAAGLNVIRGPNESGKSTLHKALLLGLFDRPTGRQAELEYRAWEHEGLYTIDLTLVNSADEQVQIVKDYDARSFRVRRAGREDSSREGLERAVQDCVGTQSEPVFTSTAHISQNAVADVAGRTEGERNKFLDEVWRVIGGAGDVNVDRVIDRLERTIHDLSPPRARGGIRRVQDEIAETEQQLGEKNSDLKQRQRTEDELAEVVQKLAAADEAIRVKRPVIERNERKTRLESELAELQKRERERAGQIKGAEDAEQRRTEAEETLSALDAFAGRTPDDHEAIQRAYDQARMRAAASARSTGGAGKGFAILLALLGLLFGIAGAVLAAAVDEAGGIALTVVGVVVFAAGVVWWWTQRRRDRAAKARPSSEGVGTEQSLEALLAPLGCRTWAEYQQKREDYRNAAQNWKSAKETLVAILNPTGKTLDALREEHRKISSEIRIKAPELEELNRHPPLSAEEYEQLNQELPRLEEETRRLEERKIALEARIAAANIAPEDVHRLEEKLEELKRQEQRLAERHQEYVLAKAMLEQAREEASKSIQKRLGDATSAYMRKLTLERYLTVEVDKDLNLAVRPDSSYSAAISPDQLSQGTRDQLYLAMRLSLLDLMFPDTMPPLILDDPLVNFDAERRAEATKMLKAVAAERQVLLFTCDEGYDKYADHVIPLARFS